MCVQAIEEFVSEVPVVGPHHHAEMFLTLESFLKLGVSHCGMVVALLGPRVLFGIGSSVLQLRWCGLSRSLQRVGSSSVGTLARNVVILSHASCFSVNMAVSQGACAVYVPAA